MLDSPLVYGPSDFHQPSGRALSPYSRWESEAQPDCSVRGIESEGVRIRRACWFAAAPGPNLLWRRSGVTRRPLIIAGRHLQNLAGPTAIVRHDRRASLTRLEEQPRTFVWTIPIAMGGSVLTLTSCRKSLGHYAGSPSRQYPQRLLGRDVPKNSTHQPTTTRTRPKMPSKQSRVSAYHKFIHGRHNRVGAITLGCRRHVK